MSPELIWFLLAVVLLVGEVFTTTFLLAPLGLAALAAAVLGWVGLGVAAQVLVFAVASLAFVGLSRPLANRLLHRGPGVRTGIAALLGAEGRVTEMVEASTGAGRVKVRGDDWRAVSEDGSPIPAGTRVVVTEVEGTTLRVVPLNFTE